MNSENAERSPLLLTGVDRSSLAFRILRRLYQPAYKLCLPRMWLSSKVIFTGLDGGIGDEFLTTSLAAELQKRGEGNLCVLTRVPELFHNNPKVRWVQPVRRDKLKHYLFWRSKMLRPTEWQTNSDSDTQVPPVRHIIAELNHLAGIRGQIALRPYLYLTAAEMKWGRRLERQVAIQSSGAGARIPFLNKQWQFERFQAVVDALKGEFNFVQIGVTSDPLLAGATDMRGRCTLRETAAILARSEIFIGQVGFPMHLARAVECRSIIIFGGREAPHQSGYSCNENLFTKLECSPCWRMNTCPIDRECLKRITPDDVVAAVGRLQLRRNSVLETDTAEL